MEEPGRHPLDQELKAGIMSVVFLSRMHAQPESGQEKTSDEPQLTVILQNRRAELFKIAKDTKVKERWRNHSRLKEMDEP